MTMDLKKENPSKSHNLNRTNSEKNVNEVVEILLNDGILSQKQIEHTYRVLSKLESARPLTCLLKELKFITDDQIKNALANNPIKMAIWDLLVELGHVTEKDLKVAQAIQENDKSKKSLEKILIDQHLIDENVLMELLSLKLGVPYIEPEFGQIDPNLFSKAPIKWFAEHRLVPLKNENHKIRIAFVDPQDKQSLQAAKQVFGEGILPALTSKSALNNVLQWAERSTPEKKASTSKEGSAVKLVNKIILAAIDREASDIHIEPLKDRLRIRFRQDGVLIPFEELSTDVSPALTNRIKVMCDVDITEKRRHQGGRILFGYHGGELDLRVSFYVTVHGEKIVMRLLNRKGLLLKIEHIGMARPMLERFKEDALYQPSGVILITGPTGSGKTTTVYSCIHTINTPQVSIITAEEPVEYVIDGISQCSINPKINLTFEETLRHIVRQDPDVIVIGEIRDNFSAEVAVQAALTGHKVLTTFHTEDSIGGLIRLLKMNIEAFLISSTVVSVLAQRLVRKVCPVCSETYKPSTAELQRLGYTADDVIGAAFRKGDGCSHCQHTGYKGRVGIFELLVLDESVRNAIIDQKTSQEIRRISIESTGLVTLIEDGIFKSASGLTTIDEVLRCLPRLQKPRPLSELRRLLGD
jgi:type IV pilus assembly protein PilB